MFNSVQHSGCLRRLAVVAALAVCAVAAHATSITYNLVGVTTSVGTLAGTVNIDSVSDLVLSSNITLNDAALGNPVFTAVGSEAAWSGLSQDYISSPSNNNLQYWGGQIELRFDTASVSSSGNLTLCLSGGVCGNNTSLFSQIDLYTGGASNGSFAVTGGSLNLAGTSNTSGGLTPEPSSLLLLGTGLLLAAIVAYVRAPKIVLTNTPVTE